MNDQSTDITPSDLPGAPKTRHPASLANLRPPWKPGQSGNPSGLTKDGLPAYSPRRILEEKLNSNEQQTLRSLINNWVKHANRGSAKHLEMILQRIDPVETENAGRVILEGIQLMALGSITPPPQPASGTDLLSSGQNSGTLPASCSTDADGLSATTLTVPAPHAEKPHADQDSASAEPAPTQQTDAHDSDDVRPS